MTSAESVLPRNFKAKLYDFVRDSHIIVSLITCTVVLMASAAYYGKVSWELAFYSIYFPFQTYAVSDWFNFLVLPGSFSKLPADRKAYRAFSFFFLFISAAYAHHLMWQSFVPLWQILALDGTVLFFAWLRSRYYHPRLRDPEVTLQTFLLLEAIDTMVFCAFISFLPTWYYRVMITAKPFFFCLSMIPIQFSMGIAWKIDDVPSKLNWHLKSQEFGSILQWWSLVSVLSIVNVVLLKVFRYGYLLVALIPLFDFMMLRAIWMEWRDYFMRFVVYVAYQAILCAILFYFFLKFPIH